MSFHFRAAAAVVVGALALVGFTAVGAEACACGAVAVPDGANVSVDAERALIKLDSGVETIAVQMNMLGGAKDAAIVVPTPSPATVSGGDAKMFSLLDEMIEPDVRVVNDWWPSAGDGAPVGRSAGAPKIVHQVHVGPLEATTLKGGTTSGLKKWLRKHDYTVPKAVQEGFKDYVKRGWSFVAVRLTSHTALDGGTPPLLIKFQSRTLIYPMKLSKAATNAQTVRTYVVGQHKMTRGDRDNNGGIEGSPSLLWAGHVDTTELDNAGLKQFFGTNDYLTVYKSYYSDPQSQITTDYRFVRAGDDEPYTQVDTRHHSVVIGGIFAGPLIAAVVIALVVAALIVVAVRMVSRRKTTRV